MTQKWKKWLIGIVTGFANGLFGSGGGTIVATGRPEDIVKVPASYTGKFLKPLLEEAAQQEGNKDYDGSLTKE